MAFHPTYQQLVRLTKHFVLYGHSGRGKSRFVGFGGGVGLPLRWPRPPCVSIAALGQRCGRFHSGPPSSSPSREGEVTPCKEAVWARSRLTRGRAPSFTDSAPYQIGI